MFFATNSLIIVELAKSNPKQSSLELLTKRTVTVTFPEGEEKFLWYTMDTACSLNCIPMTKNDIGLDVLSKIHSVLCKTLFKFAKFYSQGDKVVVIWLYDCEFYLSGCQGDVTRIKHCWVAIWSKVIFQTGILCQQVVSHWHGITIK